MTYQEKLQSIRGLMKSENVSAYIIPSSDPHISEYLPDRFKCIEFASGFTGSAGTLVITEDEAHLWTDGRYFVQATEQLKGTGYELMPLKAQGVPEYVEWLSGKLVKDSSVAFDGRLVSVNLAEMIENRLRPAGIKILPDRDYLNEIWKERPLLPSNPAYLIDESVTGEGIEQKLEKLRQLLRDAHADFHLISSLDDIAWLFNVRGSDVKCNPVVLAFALISHDNATIFIDPAKVSNDNKRDLLNHNVMIKEYHEIDTAISTIKNGTIFIDPKRTCFRLFKLINPIINVVQGVNPTTNLKAIKNAVEIENTRKTMIKDGVALTRFFKWLEENNGQTDLYEISVADKLLEFRAEQEGFVGESFDTIAAYSDHGALPHYKASLTSNAKLNPTGLFLLDSGGQYIGGTTDITRVVSLGNATMDEKTDYTLVLKGMIDGVTARYPKGTRGYQIDAITRKPLWDNSRNYGHGTGHGVGFFLNVHEGPQVFNSANITVEIEPGMITSIEPGIYRIGKYGIRIENLVLAVKDESNEFGEFYAFETLTLAYIDTSLIIRSLLDQKQIDWLNNYNQSVVEWLGKHLNNEELKWLIKKAQPI